jgi:prepilin-type N-terminal cleavage/methylation domain-containing protein
MIEGSKGVTLIEMMITVIIVAVAVALALPTWDSIMQRREVTRGAEDIAALLAVAQSQAVKRNEDVKVSVSDPDDDDFTGLKYWYVKVYTEDPGYENDDGSHTLEDPKEPCPVCVTGTTAPECISLLPEGHYSGECRWLASVGELEDEQKNVYAKMKVTGLVGFDSVITFEPMHGLILNEARQLADPSEVHLQSLQRDGKTLGDFSLRVEINATGRVSICTPDGSVPGYGDCPG